jgi:hypothetical protein
MAIPPPPTHHHQQINNTNVTVTTNNVPTIPNQQVIEVTITQHTASNGNTTTQRPVTNTMNNKANPSTPQINKSPPRRRQAW